MKDQGKLMSMLAFVALILTAVIQIVVFAVGLFDKNINLSWLSLIASIMLTAAVIWFAWQYVKGLSTFWKVVYIVVAVLAVLGAFGVTING